jgi:ligand-binding sensor domain-containing protein
VTFYSLATSPTTHGTIYAGTSSGLYLYKTGSWTQLGLADHVVTAIAIDPADPDRIYAGTGDNGAYYTRDAGLSWQTVNRNLDGLTIQSIMIDPTSPGWVYFSTKTHGIYLLKKDY